MNYIHKFGTVLCLTAFGLSACSRAPAPEPEKPAPVEVVVPKEPVITQPVIIPEPAIIITPEPEPETPAVIAPPVKPKPKVKAPARISPTKFSDGFAAFLRFPPGISLRNAEKRIVKRMAPIKGRESHLFTHDVQLNNRGEFVMTSQADHYRDPKLKGERLVLVFAGKVINKEIPAFAGMSGVLSVKN